MMWSAVLVCLQCNELLMTHEINEYHYQADLSAALGMVNIIVNHSSAVQQVLH
mgnify:CR=1 FL=1